MTGQATDRYQCEGASVEVIATGEQGRVFQVYETPRGKLRVSIDLDSGHVVTFPLFSAKWIYKSKR